MNEGWEGKEIVGEELLYADVYIHPVGMFGRLVGPVGVVLPWGGFLTVFNADGWGDLNSDPPSSHRVTESHALRSRTVQDLLCD